MRIAIASDHAGFGQKAELAEHLRRSGVDVIDHGPGSAESVDYPDYAGPVAADVAHGRADMGVLVCGTGIGMAIAANKVRGVRAANVTSPAFAMLARQHNDANVLTLSARYIEPGTNKEILDAFIATEFEAGRHELRVAKMMALEEPDS
jgi:ribose 5-phosphate isomerase B